jgi:hypothetical protein
MVTCGGLMGSEAVKESVIISPAFAREGLAFEELMPTDVNAGPSWEMV